MNKNVQSYEARLLNIENFEERPLEGCIDVNTDTTCNGRGYGISSAEIAADKSPLEEWTKIPMIHK